MKKTSRLAAAFMFIAAASLSISITGCGTSKQTTATQQQAQQQSVPEEINTAVAANADVLSIKDAALLLNNPEKTDSVARANGYTVTVLKPTPGCSIKTVLLPKVWAKTFMTIRPSHVKKAHQAMWL